MERMKEMIAEYRAQADLIRARISVLSAGVTAAQKKGEAEKAKSLADRRMMLYQEVWDMEEHLHTMEGYVRQREGRRGS